MKNLFTTQDAAMLLIDPQVGTITAGRVGRFTGHQVIVGFDWQARPGLTVSGELVHFEPGRALETAGGKQFEFVTLSAAFRF